MTLTDQKKQALDLYINQSFTQQQVADAVGVCVRTIHNWVKQHAWDRLRLATHQAPALIADNFSSQLVELQYNIAAREPGKRYPTTQEMEIMRKLTVCINNTKKTVSLPQVTQMMRMFRSYVFDTRKKEFASIVADVIDSFIEARSRFGYAPYELEFGVEKIQPLDPLYNPYHEPIIKTEPKTKEPEMPTTNPTASESTPSNVHINSEGKKIYTINTDLWDDNIRNTLMAHFGDFSNTENLPPEEQAIHASIAEKLKPVFENEKPLTVNDLSAKTQEPTGNEVGTQPLRLSLRSHSLSRSENPSELPENSPLPENETPLIINELATKKPETTGKKPATPIDPQFAGYPTSSTPPDPTVPYTYFNGKMLLTKYPDGSIRYDYGGGRPAITIKKGGPAILERRVFYI
jgi:DNA-binding XRE family transcriptional regulator